MRDEQNIARFTFPIYVVYAEHNRLETVYAEHNRLETVAERKTNA